MKTFEQFKNWWESEDVEEKNFLPIPSEIIAGKRIKLIQADEYFTTDEPLFKPGIEGTIVGTEEIEDETIIQVDWDNGCEVDLIMGEDKYEIIN